MAKVKDILQDEIDSWKGYGNVLSQPNRNEFFQMLSSLEAYKEAADAKGEQFSAESLFAALIIEQQKTIIALLEMLSHAEIKKRHDVP